MASAPSDNAAVDLWSAKRRLETKSFATDKHVNIKGIAKCQLLTNASHQLFLKCPCLKSFQIPPAVLSVLTPAFCKHSPDSSTFQPSPFTSSKFLPLRPPAWRLGSDPSAQEPASSLPVPASLWNCVCTLGWRICCFERTYLSSSTSWLSRTQKPGVHPSFSLGLKLARAADFQEPATESCSFSSTHLAVTGDNWFLYAKNMLVCLGSTLSCLKCLKKDLKLLVLKKKIFTFQLVCVELE